MPQPIRKKLIEVALPLEAINIASAREKSIRHGHPSTLHLWWARRPLAACRAVLFASLVDDPSSLPEEFPTEAEQDAERQRLFRIIEKLVLWENSNNPDVLNEAKAEILKSTGGNPPPVLDPFCGGGSIPLEAQRLGLEAHGSDLNPVAVLITKALIEIPPKFAGQPPVNPDSRQGLAHSGAWQGATGLAEDVRYYGKWMRDEAEKRIGHLYPKAQLPDGGEATVIAWIWARTVKCPNPACGCQMPLIGSFALSKVGVQTWLNPIIERGGDRPKVRFEVKSGVPDDEARLRMLVGTGVVLTHDRNGNLRDKPKRMQATFECIICHQGVAKNHYIDEEANAGRMDVIPLAVVAEAKHGRVYLPFNETHWHSATTATEAYVQKMEINELFPSEPCRGTFASNAQGLPYGFKVFSDYFRLRQLVALSTFAQLITEVYKNLLDSIVKRDKTSIKGIQANSDMYTKEYAIAICTYLTFALGRGANIWSSVTGWMGDRGALRETFARQGIAMVWDFAEANPFSEAGGSYEMFIERIADVIKAVPASGIGEVVQRDAQHPISSPIPYLYSTDPPYYGNVTYADLSDYFFVWMRRVIGSMYPELFGTMLVPNKNAELIAENYRHGGKEGARKFFESGIRSAFHNLYTSCHPQYPVVVYYAFKQKEEGGKDSIPVSTGWETMLQALLDSGFQITGTWPIHTEGAGRIVSIGKNALASSIVLACRPRPEEAPIATRREFVNALRRELEEALLHMMHGNIAPVDLPQATIGPGMAVYSRYSKVIETDGKPLRVRTALQIINQELETILSADEGDYDSDTRFCLTWFEQFGMNTGNYGDADGMARPKGASVQGLAEAGVLEAKAGKVRLFKREELPADWNPQTDERVPVWECTQQLVRALLEQGEGGAARLCAALGAKAEPARDLAYRLYSLCERKGWAQEALAYNSLVISWSEITQLASNPNIAPPNLDPASLKTGLFAEGEN